MGRLLYGLNSLPVSSRASSGPSTDSSFARCSLAPSHPGGAAPRIHQMALVSSTTLQAPPVVLVGANLAVATALAAGQARLVLVLAVLAPMTVTVVRRPQRGLLLLVALAPFDGLLAVVPAPSLVAGWKEFLVLATLGATFVGPAESRAPSDRRRTPPWAPAVVGLVVLGLLSAVVVGGLQAVIGMKVVFFYLLVALIVWRCPLSAMERDRLVSVLMLTAALTATIGIGQQVAGAERLNALGYEYNTAIRFTGGFLRSFSTFNQPFGFGFYLMLVLLIGIPVALSNVHRWRNRAFLASVPLLALAMGFTFVRGAWLGAAVGLGYLGFTRYPALLLAIPLALVALLYLPTDVSAPALSWSSSGERVASWQERISQVKENPLGLGVGASGSASEKVAQLQGGDEYYQPDNYYFKIVLELGVIGLWFFVLLLISAFGAARATAARLEGPDAALVDGVAATVVAAGVASIVATYFEIFPLDMLFWLFSGVVVTLAAEHPRPVTA